MQAVFAFVLCALFNAAIEVCRAGEGGLQTLQVTDVSENSATLHWESGASKLAKGQLKVMVALNSYIGPEAVYLQLCSTTIKVHGSHGDLKT